MHVPSYFRPYHLEYAAPRESTFERQSHANDRFKEKNRSGALVNKKVVKQVYHVKKDGRKDKSSVLDSNNEKPINVLETSATISKKMKQLGTNNLDVKSEQKKPKVPKVKDELLQFTRESQPRCRLGLSQKDMYTHSHIFQWSKRTGAVHLICQCHIHHGDLISGGQASQKMHTSSIMVGNLQGSCLGSKYTGKGACYNSKALDGFQIKVTGQEIQY